MKLENLSLEGKKNNLWDKIYLTIPLSYMSSVKLYSGDGSKEYKKYIDETYRGDGPHKGVEHDHVNWEVWFKLKGRKEGRNVGLSNTHIDVSGNSGGGGY